MSIRDSDRRYFIVRLGIAYTMDPNYGEEVRAYLGADSGFDS